MRLDSIFHSFFPLEQRAFDLGFLHPGSCAEVMKETLSGRGFIHFGSKMRVKINYYRGLIILSHPISFFLAKMVHRFSSELRFEI